MLVAWLKEYWSLVMTTAPFLLDVSTRTRDYRLHRVERHVADRYMSSMLGPILKLDTELGL